MRPVVLHDLRLVVWSCRIVDFLAGSSSREVLSMEGWHNSCYQECLKAYGFYFLVWSPARKLCGYSECKQVYFQETKLLLT